MSSATVCEQVLELSERVRSAAAAGDGRTLAVSDPAARWAVEQVLSGRHLPMNRATLSALQRATRELEPLSA